MFKGVPGDAHLPTCTLNIPNTNSHFQVSFFDVFYHSFAPDLFLFEDTDVCLCVSFKFIDSRAVSSLISPVQQGA